MKGWLKAKAAAEYASVSERTIRTWLAEGGLKFSKVGGNVLIRISDLDEYLEGFAVTKDKARRQAAIVDELLRGVRQ